ncbi:MAG: acetyltransferase, family [Firmicutes bacterium]|nr:acetyltransferase, family [Bacillota bacterium]
MIRTATMDDVSNIMKIVQAVIVEMHSYNNFQWDENYPQIRDFAGDIEKGDLFVSIREEMIAGFICINRVQPTEYNGLKWSLSEEALVIHRMAVSPDCRNIGVGFELVNFADELAKKNNVRYLKTDTYSLNTNAQGLFQKLGYIFVGEMSFLGKEKPFYCYEKWIEVIPQSSK